MSRGAEEEKGCRKAVRLQRAASSADAELSTPSGVAARRSGRPRPGAATRRAGLHRPRVARVRHQVDECGRLHRAGQVGDPAAAQACRRSPGAFERKVSDAHRLDSSPPLRAPPSPAAPPPCRATAAFAGDASLPASSSEPSAVALEMASVRPATQVLQRGARLRLRRVGGLGRRGSRRDRRPGRERRAPPAASPPIELPRASSVSSTRTAASVRRRPRAAAPPPRGRSRCSGERRGTRSRGGRGGGRQGRYRRVQLLPLLHAVRARELAEPPRAPPPPPPAAGQSRSPVLSTALSSPGDACRVGSRRPANRSQRRRQLRRTLPQTRATLAQRDPRPPQCSFGRRPRARPRRRGAQSRPRRSAPSSSSSRGSPKSMCSAPRCRPARSSVKPRQSTRRPRGVARVPMETSAFEAGDAWEADEARRWTPTRSPPPCAPWRGSRPGRAVEARAAGVSRMPSPRTRRCAPLCTPPPLHLDAVASRRGDGRLAAWAGAVLERRRARTPRSATPGGPGASAAGGPRATAAAAVIFITTKKSPRLAVSRRRARGGGGPRTYRRGVERFCAVLLRWSASRVSGTRARPERGGSAPPARAGHAVREPRAYFDVQRAVARRARRAGARARLLFL